MLWTYLNEAPISICSFFLYLQYNFDTKFKFMYNQEV